MNDETNLCHTPLKEITDTVRREFPHLSHRVVKVLSETIFTEEQRFLYGRVIEQPQANATLKPIYVLHPGPVFSKTDGDRHIISAQQLMWLYRVNPADCVVFGRKAPKPDDRPIVHLWPRYDGDYTLPKVPQ